MTGKTPHSLLPPLLRAWRQETALVVQELFGGEILKTRVGGAWHL
jgi:hypothetical protein